MSKTIRMAVRDFALPIRPRGDLDTAAGQAVLNLGVELHEAIQAKRKKAGGYRKEVTLSHNFARDGFKFSVTGRADGILDGKPVLVEEIKSTHSLTKLQAALEANPEHPYILQTQLYCYFYAMAHEHVPAGRLLLVSSRTRKERVFDVPFDVDKFEEWLDRKLDALVAEIHRAEARKQRRKETAAGLRFPFSKQRNGQQELMDTVDDALQDGVPLLCQAPTGLGKTLGIMLPALKDALARGSQLVYVAPKNSQFQVALDTVRALAKSSEIPPKVLIMKARSKVCLQEEVHCDPDICPYAREYHDKYYDSGMPEKVAQCSEFSSETLIHWGQLEELCPYALAHNALEEADIIVCDYNYVFSPRAILAHLFAERPKRERLNLVIDEAHNLYERAMDYYSPALTLSLLGDLRIAMESFPRNLKISCGRFMNKVIEAIVSYRPEDGKTGRVELDPNDWLHFADQCCGLLVTAMSDDKVPTEPLMDLYISLLNFGEILSAAGPEICTMYMVGEENEGLKAKCLDPSKYLEPTFGEFRGVVAFSATLKPFEFFRRLMGLPADTRIKEFQSTFPKENRKVLVIPQVSTAYRDREKNYEKIGNAITRIVATEPGHYAVFFPSYAFMNRVAPHIEGDGYEILQQTSGMTMEAVQHVSTMLRQNDQLYLLLAVQGGVLAEGVDFHGDMLRGAMIIGPALPQYDYEREQLRAYYEQTYDNGFGYAYVYPAMAKSVQAAGRIIRSESKRGLLVFMDKRFVQTEYASSMPSGWFDESVNELVSDSILSEIRSFWESESLPDPSVS